MIQLNGTIYGQTKDDAYTVNNRFTINDEVYVKAGNCEFRKLRIVRIHVIFDHTHHHILKYELSDNAQYKETSLCASREDCLKEIKFND